MKNLKRQQQAEWPHCMSYYDMRCSCTEFPALRNGQFQGTAPHPAVPRREDTAGPSDRTSAGTPPQALLPAADHSRRAVGARVRALSSIQLSCSHSDSAGGLSKKKAQGLEWSWELLTQPLWSGNPQPAPLIQGCDLTGHMGNSFAQLRGREGKEQ